MSSGYQQLLPRRAPRSAASQAWGISFSDLITLLLCFFISFIPRALENRSGTLVALKEVGVVIPGGESLVRIPEAGFSDEQELTPEWQSKVLNLLGDWEGEAVTSVQLRGCESPDKGVSLLRTLTVLRQITGTAGLAAELVTVEPESGSCQIGNSVEVIAGRSAKKV